MADEIQELRSRLRSEGIRLRDEIPENLHIAFSHLIKKSALSLLEETNAKNVHCYLSFRSEVDTSSLIHALRSDGINVISPVTVEINGVSMLEHYVLTNERETGMFGVPEPKRQKKFDPDMIDAVIVPVVAYDGTGTRLGYGKGYYDKFLSGLSLDVPKIGLAFSVQETYSIPPMPHDVRLDYIINEQAVIEVDQ
jgi:5-formyltetrahydrofolate cyclo-ligase